MVNSYPKTEAQIKELLIKLSSILDSSDYERFSEVLAKDVLHKSPSGIDNGVDACIASMKHHLSIMPPLKIVHFAPEHIDIAPSGTIYATGYSTFTFLSHPNETVKYDVCGVYKLVPEGEPEAGKIISMVSYEDHSGVVMLLQKIMGEAKDTKS